MKLKFVEASVMSRATKDANVCSGFLLVRAAFAQVHTVLGELSLFLKLIVQTMVSCDWECWGSFFKSDHKRHPNI